MADPKYVKDFIDQMTPYAVAVGDQYGIDPITIITQAAVETGWGREVAGNNYFGVKSHGRPGGQNITTHEEINGKRVKVQDNFRSYGSLGESVADYGRFLSENPRYAEALKETGRSELKGIANAGYATSSDYKDLTNNVAGMVERNIRPLPPGSLPEVGTLTDTVPPRAAAPATMSPDLAQMRRTNIPSQLMPDTFASLASGRTKGQTRAADLGLTEKTAATPYLKRNGDVLDPAGVVLGKEMVTQLPGTRKAVPQSQIDRNPVAALPELPRPRPNTSAPLITLPTAGRPPIGLVAPGNLDLNSRKVLTDGVGGYRTENSMSIGTDRGEALIPTVVDGRQLSEQAAIDHYLKTGENLGYFATPQAADRYAEALHERQGQRYGGSLPKAVPQSQIERNPVSPAPAPAQQSPQMAGRRATDQALQIALNSRFPTPLPPIPPSTLGRQSVQQSQIDRGTPRVAAAAPVSRPRVTVSTPFTTPQSPIERSAARTVTQSPVGQPPATRVVQSVPMPPMQPTAAATLSASDRARAAKASPAQVQTYIPGPPSVAKDETRLLPTPALPPANYGVAQTAPARPPTPFPTVARAPAPIPAPPYNAVASDLDVRPMPSLPRPRPDLGMGGVDIPAIISQTGQFAPTPMPRLQRPGLFGRPQVFGHDIPLPGIFGVLQNATMAMNNASGPFRTGADNALYNGLRGGDFNTPGAATRQAGGFLYAQKPGGGFINVGRVNPAQSGAALYDSRNTRNDSRDDAANRVNGSSSRGSGGARSLLD